jgi:hypothetical protein
MEKQNFATSIVFLPWNWRRSDHGKALSDFIASLSALHWNLSWRTVGDAVIRSYACSAATA